MTILQFKGEHAFLSNFYPCTIHFEGETYPSVEHAYQAAKTKLYAERMFVRESITAAVAKKRGKTATLREGWSDMRVPVMRALLREKFKLPGLGQRLLDTDNEELVEGNWWGDHFWGRVAGGEEDGENWLGLLLMEIRAELRGNDLRN